MSIFETTASNDPLGLWDFAPQPVSFALGDENPNAPEPVVPVYSVNLPADFEASSQALSDRESRFARIDSALDTVPARLDDLVSRLQAARPEAGSGASFAVPDSEADSTPEGELLSLLADSDAAARSGAGPEGVSFGLSEVTSAAFGEAKSRFEAFLEQMNHEVLHFAWVETKVAEQFIARTELGWSGDSSTIWADGISAGQKSLHQRALNITTRTRHVKMRLFVTIASGAAKVAVLTATGAPVLALPAVYQYVTKIVSQVKELQSV
jgi:hypothetical protein